MLPDLRYAWRSLRRTPVFTTVAVISLAAGISLAAAVFRFADQVLWCDLPVRHAAELLYFTNAASGDRFSYPIFQDFRDRSAVFDAVAARYSTPVHFRYNNRNRRIFAEIVSGTWFETLGLEMALGRGFTPEDDRVPGGHSVAVLTYDFWKSQFGGDRGILHRIIQLNGHPMTVIGVAGRGYRGFDLGRRTDVLVPTMMKAAMTPAWNGLDDRGAIWLEIVGRLHPDVTVEQAEARLAPFYRALADLEPGLRGMIGEERPIRLIPAAQGVSELRERLAGPLRTLSLLAGLLLVFACGNTIGLLQARAASRRSGMAIRMALGATRRRLAPQFIAESLVLAAIAAGVALLGATWIGGGTLDLAANAGETGLSGGLDLEMTAFAAGLALLAGAALTIASASRARWLPVADVLKERPENGQIGGGRAIPIRAMVVAEAAAAVVLLAGAADAARSLHQLNRTDLGFRRDGLLSFSVDPALNGYSAERVRRFAEALRQRLAAVPGVVSAAVAGGRVLGDGEARAIRVAGYAPSTPLVSAVGPGYFATLGVPLLEGREFRAADRDVAVLNDAFVNAPGARTEHAPGIAAVGVVRGIRSRVSEPAAAAAYVPLLQSPLAGPVVVYVRTAADPRRIFAAMYREVAQLDSALPVSDMRTMNAEVADALTPQRVTAAVAATVAGIATLLAAIGGCCLVVNVATRRKREIGIRMALGAGRHSMRRAIMADVAVPAAAGVAIGTGLAVAFADGARDPVSLAAAGAGLLAVVMGATYVPAWREAKVSAGAALRE